MKIEKSLCEAHEVKKGYASYSTIVNLSFKNIILCNTLAYNDEFFYDSEPVTGSWVDENGVLKDFYQFYLTDASTDEIDMIKKRFGDTLTIVYNDTLGLYVLCVDHWGTAWKYVYTDIEIE